MRIARYRSKGGVRLAVVDGTDLVDVTAATDEADVISLLDEHRDTLEAVVAGGGGRIGIDEVVYEPPVRPSKFFAIGLNYDDHVGEAGLERPTVPQFFNKQPSCISGSGQDIVRPRASDALDYEGELGIVIGRRCRHVSRELAPTVIAGYLIVNDVSVRDWQLASPTITLGKSWDTHGPLGPWLTSADEIMDPHALEIVTYVNGDERQRSNTRHLIFDCYDQIAHLSTVCTLEPGDVIATGTPSGVGALMTPPSWLVPGDRVRIEVSGLGALENVVVQEADSAPRIEIPIGARTCAG